MHCTNSVIYWKIFARVNIIFLTTCMYMHELGTVFWTIYLCYAPYYRQPTCLKYCIIDHLSVSDLISIKMYRIIDQIFLGSTLACYDIVPAVSLNAENASDFFSPYTRYVQVFNTVAYYNKRVRYT